MSFKDRLQDIEDVLEFMRNNNILKFKCGDIELELASTVKPLDKDQIEKQRQKFIEQAANRKKGMEAAQSSGDNPIFNDPHFWGLSN